MAQRLQKYGFTVIHKQDLNQRQFKNAVRDFKQRISKNGISLFYYAGHGIQIEGRNYLIPVGSDILSAEDVEYNAIDAQWIVKGMSKVGSRVNIIILDACRNNPFRGFFRSQDGLAAMQAPDGTIISSSDGFCFAMGRYEVTFAEYDKFAQATGREKPSDQGWGRGNRPVINVSWYEATAYAKWLSQQTGQQYRLPTEAEWEYAARAGKTTKYWWGNQIGSNKANCSNSSCGDRFKYTAPVGSFAPNPFKLYDTAGNVWEWVRDWYDKKYYSHSPTRDPKGNAIKLRTNN